MIICIGKFFYKKVLPPFVYILVKWNNNVCQLESSSNLLFEVPFWFWVLAESHFGANWCILCLLSVISDINDLPEGRGGKGRRLRRKAHLVLRWSCLLDHPSSLSSLLETPLLRLLPKGYFPT